MEQNTRLPIKLGKDSIVECVLELRFETVTPPAAVFGVVFQVLANQLKKPKVVTLPLSTLPIEIKERDPNLKFQPCWQIIEESLIIGISSHSISFSTKRPYIGWSLFSSRVVELTNAIFESKFFLRISRIGLRYINFFDEDLKTVTGLRFETSKEKIDSIIPSTLKFVERNENCQLTCVLGNEVDVLENNNNVKRTVVDIDAFIDCSLSNASIKKDFFNLINNLHFEEKKKFFTLLKDDYIKMLTPEYN